ncbi:MAG: hypothetical protein HN742_22560 [Lentisphaerae bacterium]|jgi:hypothetical protein|nr:hypothetical protein [Lentisphaerota bacterium]MBT4818048.1 hypothetical protein [Lentisphaerota bacterium]MBT5605018.1 hypothetical protein [Lentisphaerota bacterium]MBT7054648.1 hypothetical protein [Lentisphaerota bacterium]MBT7844677.1 hypothetical protein [Lentisphaerota bacterium]
MFQQYKDRAAFLLIYIREAHPTDGWQVKANVRDKVVYAAPKAMDDRALIASDCLKGLKLTLPCLLDDMQGSANRDYAAWPARFCIVRTDGTVHYYSGRGPRGFKPKEAENALIKLLEEGAPTAP